MPIYEFKCPECGDQQEKLQKFDDPAPPCTKEGCARCTQPMERLVSRTSFELRGGGWAKDGYGS